jgi:PQQ-like domain
MRPIPFIPIVTQARGRRANASPIVLLLFVCALLLLTSCGKKSTATSAGQKTGAHLKWAFRGSGSGHSPPALGPDGTIYVGTGRSLQAVSPDGRLLWDTPLNAPDTPLISEDGTIYIALRPGIVFGVSKEGKYAWRPGYGLIGFNSPPALGPDTTLYYLNTVGDIFAFQPKRSEQTIWSLNTFREGMLGTATVLPGSARVGVISTGAAPVVTSSGSIIVPRQNFLHSISSGGSPEWELQLTSGSLGQAALATDGTIYVGDSESVLYAVDSSGSKKWQFDATGSVTGSPVIDSEGVVYFSAGDAVYAVNPDGSLKWRFSPIPHIYFYTGPTLAADGTLYVGSETALLALHSDGTLKWNLHVYSPNSAATIAPDGTIYFSCGYFWLCAVEDSGSPLMQSAWPKQFHDSANTSNTLHSAL